MGKENIERLDFATKILTFLTFATYLSGFLVTNTYFASLGILSLEIVRTRYISSGILFLLYSSLVIYFVYYSVIIWLDLERKVIYEYVWKLIRFFFIKLILIIVLLGALSSLTELNLERPKIQYTNSEISSYFSALNLWIFYYPVLLSLLISLANLLSEIGKNRKAKKANNVKELAALFLKQFTAYVFFILLIFIAFPLGRILLGSTYLSIQLFPILIPSGGWVRFLLCALVTYLVVILFIVSRTNNVTESSENSKDNSKEPNPFQVNFLRVLSVLFLLLFMIPSFSIAVYPYLSQQIGGGKLIKLESIQMSPNSSIALDSERIYLIDRSSTFLTVYIENAERGKVIELPKSDVRLIEYVKYR